ncbi:hypothetical protein L211DRAFT_595203 [Terfezia boudieri ATCC MYA-4762]|uniref:Uncharacterized protein n=1 Tax=Terfezia boudieri ATCC MYA-4762 TaxID=1051890 RepID=A0A3N4L9Z7_9PEZI|nr:hypothetical protein L211DRAFT_595203 [Terfezia boudieri ATCC MYA-4762]
MYDEAIGTLQHLLLALETSHPTAALLGNKLSSCFSTCTGLCLLISATSTAQDMGFIPSRVQYPEGQLSRDTDMCRKNSNGEDGGNK